MRSLVGWFGCYDAAAETINARWGGGANKGTISKKLAGHADFTLSDVIALEDAARIYPITRLLARRLENRDQTKMDCLIAQTGVIAKEGGEAVAAILAAEQSADAEDTAQAVVEVDEAIQSLRAARARLEAET